MVCRVLTFNPTEAISVAVVPIDPLAVAWYKIELFLKPLKSLYRRVMKINLILVRLFNEHDVVSCWFIHTTVILLALLEHQCNVAAVAVIRGHFCIFSLSQFAEFSSTRSYLVHLVVLWLYFQGWEFFKYFLSLNKARYLEFLVLRTREISNSFGPS